MHGVKGDAAALKPVRDFAHMLFAVGVVDVLACGKQFNRLRPTPDQSVQQARVQALFHINVCRYRVKHNQPMQVWGGHSCPPPLTLT
jgi:hypothetical protein